LGEHVAKLDAAEMAANRHGTSTDSRADAAVRFARQVMERRGHVTDQELRAVRDAGYSDPQIIEIVQHVALNTWTNYINSVAQTVIDFPVVTARKVA
jgi:alkylhydroperoxidase family enzyme